MQAHGFTVHVGQAFGCVVSVQCIRWGACGKGSSWDSGQKVKRSLGCQDPLQDLSLRDLTSRQLAHLWRTLQRQTLTLSFVLQFLNVFIATWCYVFIFSS